MTDSKYDNTIEGFLHYLADHSYKLSAASNHSNSDLISGINHVTVNGKHIQQAFQHAMSVLPQGSSFSVFNLSNKDQAYRDRFKQESTTLNLHFLYLNSDRTMGIYYRLPSTLSDLNSKQKQALVDYANAIFNTDISFSQVEQYNQHHIDSNSSEINSDANKEISQDFVKMLIDTDLNTDEEEKNKEVDRMNNKSGNISEEDKEALNNLFELFLGSDFNSVEKKLGTEHDKQPNSSDLNSDKEDEDISDIHLHDATDNNSDEDDNKPLLTLHINDTDRNNPDGELEIDDKKFAELKPDERKQLSKFIKLFTGLDLNSVEENKEKEEKQNAKSDFKSDENRMNNIEIDNATSDLNSDDNNNVSDVAHPNLNLLKLGSDENNENDHALNCGNYTNTDLKSDTDKWTYVPGKEVKAMLKSAEEKAKLPVVKQNELPAEIKNSNDDSYEGYDVITGTKKQESNVQLDVDDNVAILLNLVTDKMMDQVNHPELHKKFASDFKNRLFSTVKNERDALSLAFCLLIADSDILAKDSDTDINDRKKLVERLDMEREAVADFSFSSYYFLKQLNLILRQNGVVLKDVHYEAGKYTITAEIMKTDFKFSFDSKMNEHTLRAAFGDHIIDRKQLDKNMRECVITGIWQGIQNVKVDYRESNKLDRKQAQVIWHSFRNNMDYQADRIHRKKRIAKEKFDEKHGLIGTATVRE